MPKIYIIAGESSGDYIGSLLIKELKNLNHANAFKGVGGHLMEQEAGFTSLFPIKHINIMGFAEIIPHLFHLYHLVQLTVNDIIKWKPDVLITIDSPGFTYRVAQSVHKITNIHEKKIKLIHLCAPSVWAYKPSRAFKYAQIYDHLLALLPFEPPYFTKVNLPCTYIGHPILEQNFCCEKTQARNILSINLNRTVICVTVGSRLNEIKMHLPIFCKALNLIQKDFTNLEVIFVLNNDHYLNLVIDFLTSPNNNIKFQFKCTANKIIAYAAADVAIAKSGTNVLEIAASNTPLIVAYKANWLSFTLIKMIIKIKHITILNLLSSYPYIPELIQKDCNPKTLAYHAMNLLSNSKLAQEQIKHSQTILNKLKNQDKTPPSVLAAKIIKNIIKQ